jgi:hypothetical protein
MSEVILYVTRKLPQLGPTRHEPPGTRAPSQHTATILEQLELLELY